MLHNIGAIDLKTKQKTRLITRRGIKFIDSYCSDRTNECSPGLAFNLILLAAVVDELKKNKGREKSSRRISLCEGNENIFICSSYGDGGRDGAGERKNRKRKNGRRLTINGPIKT